MSHFQKSTSRVWHVWQGPDPYGNIFSVCYFSELREVYIRINTKDFWHIDILGPNTQAEAIPIR